MEMETLAPWEIENGFDAQGRQARQELFSRSQWRSLGRRVIVSDEEAVRMAVNSNTGHHLYLFAMEQTVARRPA